MIDIREKAADRPEAGSADCNTSYVISKETVQSIKAPIGMLGPVESNKICVDSSISAD